MSKPTTYVGVGTILHPAKFSEDINIFEQVLSLICFETKANAINSLNA